MSKLMHTYNMVGSAGLLNALGSALNRALASGRSLGVAASLQAQDLRCFASAAAVRGAEAAASVQQERVSPSGGAAAERGAESAGTTTISSSSASTSKGGEGFIRGVDGGGFSVDLRRVVSDRRTAEQGALEGIIHIQNTFNNIILTLTDYQGFIKTYTSAGIVGFRGARRSQPVAAERAAEELARRALKLGYSTVSIRLKGPGNTKQYAVQSLAAAGLQIKSLADVTPIPYNGCRPPKRRRV